MSLSPIHFWCSAPKSDAVYWYTVDTIYWKGTTITNFWKWDTTIRELFIPLLEPCSFWPQLPCMSSPSFIYRSLWPNDIFGNETDNAVQTLLHIYFRHQTLGQTGCLAVVGPSRDLSQASTRLMELNLQIREALSQAQAYKPHTTMVSTGLWSGGTAGCVPGQTPHPPPYTELSSG